MKMKKKKRGGFLSGRYRPNNTSSYHLRIAFWTYWFSEQERAVHVLQHLLYFVSRPYCFSEQATSAV